MVSAFTTMKNTPLLLALVLVSPGFAAERAFPVFEAQTVSDKVGIGYGVAVADIDGDKLPDLILVDKAEVAWFKNPSWEKHTMVTSLTKQDHVCLAVRDIDGDGRAEVAVGAAWNPGDTVNSGAVFWLEAPADRTQLWKAVELPHEPTVHRMKWVADGKGGFELVVAPLHGRGNKNGQGEGAKILAYSRPASPDAPWTTRVVSGQWHQTHNFTPRDFTSAAGEELIVAGREGVFLCQRDGESWKQSRLATSATGAGEISLGKGPEGSRFLATIEPMHGNEAVIYTPKEGQAGDWERTVLDESLVDGHAVVCADFAGTGSDQIVVGWRAMGKPGVKVGVKLFQRDGGKWLATMVDDAMACEDLVAADLNNDGLPDLVAAGRATHNLKVYWNRTKK